MRNFLKNLFSTKNRPTEDDLETLIPPEKILARKIADGIKKQIPDEGLYISEGEYEFDIEGVGLVEITIYCIGIRTRIQKLLIGGNHIVLGSENNVILEIFNESTTKAIKLDEEKRREENRLNIVKALDGEFVVPGPEK